jgi:hypothetical protein
MRAEMYYKRRPGVIRSIPAYKGLADRYDIMNPAEPPPSDDGTAAASISRRGAAPCSAST